MLNPYKLMQQLKDYRCLIYQSAFPELFVQDDRDLDFRDELSATLDNNIVAAGFSKQNLRFIGFDRIERMNYTDKLIILMKCIQIHWYTQEHLVVDSNFCLRAIFEAKLRIPGVEALVNAWRRTYVVAGDNYFMLSMPDGASVGRQLLNPYLAWDRLA